MPQEGEGVLSTKRPSGQAAKLQRPLKIPSDRLLCIRQHLCSFACWLVKRLLSIVNWQLETDVVGILATDHQLEAISTLYTYVQSVGH